MRGWVVALPLIPSGHGALDCCVLFALCTRTITDPKNAHYVPAELFCLQRVFSASSRERLCG